MVRKISTCVIWAFPVHPQSSNVYDHSLAHSTCMTLDDFHHHPRLYAKYCYYGTNDYGPIVHHNYYEHCMLIKLLWAKMALF